MKGLKDKKNTKRRKLFMKAIIIREEKGNFVVDQGNIRRENKNC